jgi:hypothetical protein
MWNVKMSGSHAQADYIP